MNIIVSLFTQLFKNKLRLYWMDNSYKWFLKKSAKYLVIIQKQKKTDLY